MQQTLFASTFLAIAGSLGAAPTSAVQADGPFDQFMAYMAEKLEVPPKMNLEYWKELCSFRPPVEVQSGVKKRGDGWFVQRIENAGGPLSLDYYSARVSKLPVLPGTSTSIPAEELFGRFIQQLLDPGERASGLLTFVPKSSAESPFAIGNMLSIRFYTKPALSPAVAQLATRLKERDLCSELYWKPFIEACRTAETVAGNAAIKVRDQVFAIEADEGYVVVSQSSPRELRLSTIQAGPPSMAGMSENAGRHPVSGNRAFGYSKLQSGALAFYVMGADRATETFTLSTPSVLAAVGFGASDLYWRAFLADFVDYVNANGGSAEVKITVAGRIPWSNDAPPQIFDTAGAPPWK